MMDYKEFLEKKKTIVAEVGKLISDEDINPMLFEFQRDIVSWAVRMGRCAIFADTGMGKTFIQLEWARLIGNPVLIFAPLSVARQTIREGKKIKANVKYVKSDSELSEGINITNYENIDNFQKTSGKINAIILDESSILKAIDGKTRKKLIDYFSKVPYKLC